MTDLTAVLLESATDKYTIVVAISVAAIASILIVILFIANRIRAQRRLSHIPGPWLAGWTRFWMVRANISGRYHEILYDTNVKYGSLARIGPNHLLTSDPAVIRRMNAPRSPYRRAPWYSVFRFKPRADNIITYLDEDKHEDLRRKMAPGYSGKEVPNVEETIDKWVLEWVKLIERKYISSPSDTKLMDLARQAQYFTLDVISDLAFGDPFGDIVDDTDKFDYIKTTEEAAGPIGVLAIFPRVHKWIEQSRVIDLLAPSAKDKTGLGPILNITRMRVEEQFAQTAEKQQPTMMGSFIRHGLTKEEAESESVLQVMAGSDTSATVIRVVLLHVLTSPEILSKLRAEIDEGICEGRISSPIRDSEARQLPYLQACIKEALRLWPPVVGMLQKIVAPEGDTIDGVFVPGGTLIAQNTWSLGRQPLLHGPDFALFKPERWLPTSSSSPANLAQMERDAELTFGYGRFKCLGQPVALMELNKVFVELLRRFEISVARPEKPWRCESRGIFLMKEFWVRVQRREGVEG
ncbi:cytochrome P450 [Patellaria atrata CBS 101060]|uniref:Cytochrome P450 n=1 Tax=Patellaria atrata CBS 101060 TaxID=1346257 RepID=A0A9P4S2D3_9PEZI|nr:cytochrome P450 [Patellaria atrata CBS 101060]